MAQTEDTELRDLVMEALERNGSLAKIRALLRANIFLAFEDDCENMKQNLILDNILKLPEGKLALTIVHEFLEYCNLKNSLFVYMSESRQGNEYTYDGKKSIAEKLHISKCDNMKEPILITLIKNAFKTTQKIYSHQSDGENLKKYDKSVDSNYKDDQNCTYIVHEDSQSSSTSNSHSENSSSDEKNKLHLRLHLDNSDTDTSSDSIRDKSNSEYVPSDHILDAHHKNDTQSKVILHNPSNCGDARDISNLLKENEQKNVQSTRVNELKLKNNSSSESTSYIELKPFTSLDEKMLNTAGLPSAERNVQVNEALNIQNKIQPKTDSDKSATISNISSVSAGNDKLESGNKKSQDSIKSDGETAEYSFDFSLSPASKHQDRPHKHTKPLDSGQENLNKQLNINSNEESAHQISQSSQSSVSLSDVADLISEKSFVSHHTSKDKSSGKRSNLSGSNHSKKIDSKQSKIASDDSGDFTESPVPSLSNLSLDFHSD